MLWPAPLNAHLGEFVLTIFVLMHPQPANKTVLKSCSTNRKRRWVLDRHRLTYLVADPIPHLHSYCGVERAEEFLICQTPFRLQVAKGVACISLNKSSKLSCHADNAEDCYRVPTDTQDDSDLNSLLCTKIYDNARQGRFVEMIWDLTLTYVYVFQK